MRRFKKGTLGFTVIELMIIVAIMGILAAIAMPRYKSYKERVQKAQYGRTVKSKRGHGEARRRGTVEDYKDTELIDELKERGYNVTKNM